MRNDTTHQIAAAEAAKQIRGKIVDLTGVSLDYRDHWMEKIIQAAIEKATKEKDEVIHLLRQERATGWAINHAAHASERLGITGAQIEWQETKAAHASDPHQIAAEAAKLLRKKFAYPWPEESDPIAASIIQSAIEQVRTETLAECRAATEQQICDLQDRSAHAREPFRFDIRWTPHGNEIVGNPNGKYIEAQPAGTAQDSRAREKYDKPAHAGSESISEKATGVSLDYRDQWIEKIIQSAIEKAQSAAYDAAMNFWQSRAEHASEP